MEKLTLVLAILLIVTDLITIEDLRKLLRSFLLAKSSSTNKVRKLHNEQTFKERLLLSYIGSHIDRNVIAFQRWWKVYFYYMVSIVPQYLLFLVIFLLMENGVLAIKSLAILLSVTWGVKLFFSLFVRAQFDSLFRSKYQKNYRKRR